jgi:predicted enzyme related to lactoylglutathione lyase
MPPTFANGKICYLQIPAEDIARSAGFYQQVFGWNIRQNNHGHTAFDDTVGGVSGAWVTGRPPDSTPGILIYIMVDSVAASMEAITAAGGKIVQPIGGDPGEITSRFSDPAGNVVGLYEHNSKT